MAPKNAEALRQRVQGYVANIMVLRQHFPAIYAQLYAGQHSVVELPEWQAMVKRSEALQAQGEHPALVAILYGPTGAGKSTLFRLLTGVQVPAGDSRRPMSYTCTLAVPEDMLQAEPVARLFPQFQLQRLQSMQQLTQPQPQANVLLYTPYAAVANVPLILVDVPDFDSVAQANWAQAEAMLERAEIVLFLVYGEAYANDVVVQALARGCKLAAQLAYVFTKTVSSQAAREKWHDLLEQLRKPGTSQARLFQERRADGQTLLAFLEGCAVYYSPRREGPEQVALSDFQPVSGGPDFLSLLQGLDAEKLLFGVLVEPTRRVVNVCRAELDHVHSRIRELQADLARAAEPLQDIAAKIAASEFPISRLVELVIKEAGKTQGTLQHLATAPFRMISQVMGSVRDAAVYTGKALLQLFRDTASEHAAVRPWMDLEQERLQEGLVADHGLFHTWRQHALLQSQTHQSLLTQERLETLRAALQRTPIPAPAQDWEGYVGREVATWAREHPWLCYLLPGLSDIVTVVGGAVFVVDLCTTGGLFGSTIVLGSLGAAGAVAAGGSAVGIVTDWVTQWQLERVVQQAQERWREQRSRELREHLEQHLLHPVFQPLFDQLRALQQADVVTCRQACDALDLLLQQAPGV